MKRICSHCRATFEWPVTLLPEEESLSKLSAEEIENILVNVVRMDARLNWDTKCSICVSLPK